MVEAYCVKCRKKQEMQKPLQTKLSNGRAAVRGGCGVCGTNLVRMGRMPE